MSEQVCELIRREDEKFVEAKLFTTLNPADFFNVEQEWFPSREEIKKDLLNLGVSEKEWPESLYWNWNRKSDYLNLLEATGFGINCEDKCQGMMLTKTASHFAKLPGEEGKPLVYVDYLETAPWNWRIEAIARQGRFKGIGLILMRAAVEQSLREEFHGRVGLHALPQAENYYRNFCGMTPITSVPHKDRLLYFEFSRKQSEVFLQGGE